VTVLEIEIACSQWEGAASTQRPQLFNLGFGAGGWGGEGGRGFYVYLFTVADVFPPCSQVVPQVLNVFPKGVPNSWVGGWRGGFCFKLYLSGLSSVHLDSGLSMQVLLRKGGWGRGRICFPFSQWEGPRCLAFTPFQFRGPGRIFFSFFPVSQCVPTLFPLSS